MPRHINSADVLHTLKSLLYETALNQDDLRYSEVFEDIAKNRIETWVDLMPTADVVDKERYDRLLENAIIISAALNNYQTADMVEVVRCKDCKWRHDDSNPQYLPCTDWYPQDDFFCAYGERKETEDETSD